MDRNIKVSYESYGKITTIENKEDIDVYELGELLYGLCVSQGWSKETLKEIFKKSVIDG